MKAAMSAAARFLRLPRSRKLLLCEAACRLPAARLAVKLIPFSRIAARNARPLRRESGLDAVAMRELATEIAWAINAANRHLPYDFLCLPRALAAKAMLRRRGVRSTLSLGVRRSGERDLEAHAWLVAGGVVLTGEREMTEFTEIESFTEPGP